MERLPELSGLSHADKDQLIRFLWESLEELREELSELRAAVQRLETENAALRAQLAKDSTNSSKPPASDGLRKTCSLRQPSERPVGGVPGHPGFTLPRSETPDFLVDHLPPQHCEACGTPLEAGDCQSRQVSGLPAPVLEVTGHRRWQTRCGCGHLQQGTFPDEVQAPVQYGPRFRALVVCLTQHQMLPAKRTGELLEAWCGVHPSTGTDETGVRAGGRLHWLHALVTESLSWLSTHPKRGALAFEGLERLPRFQNILVHDGFKSCAKLECGHALCNAHLLRELTFQARHRQQDWAAEMIGLLCEALKTTRLSPQGLTRSQIEDFRSRCETKLREGWKLNPPDPPDAYPGPTPQTDTVNLLRRLQDGADEVLRFTRDPRVPFTNNEAGREVRMPKVKLRSREGSGLQREHRPSVSFVPVSPL